MKQALNVSYGMAFALLLVQLGGCSTAPKELDREEFRARAESTTAWFERSVVGLREQIQGSAGYIIFPDVAQWGLLYGGGTWGRGAVYTPDGQQTAWAALNTGSIGLQIGVQGFRMLMVLENQQVLEQFQANKLTGSVGGVAVAGQAAATGKPAANSCSVTRDNDRLDMTPTQCKRPGGALEGPKHEGERQVQTVHHG